MIVRLHTCALTILCSIFAPYFSSADETKEPPLKLTLTIDGNPIDVELGQQQVLPGEFKNPTVVVQAAENRHFSYGGISFDYPANFTWEADIDGKDYRSWIISGNDCTIMYFALGKKFTPKTYTDEMAEKFGAKNSLTEPVSRKFGKATLRGTRVTLTIGGEVKIAQDALLIPAPKGEWRLLVLQDVVPAESDVTDEPKRVLELLSKSFSLVP